MLLPAINNAKQKASQIRCTGNYRQIFLAAANYASDQKEYLPFTMGIGTGLWGPYNLMWKSGDLKLKVKDKGGILHCSLYNTEPSLCYGTNSHNNYQIPHYNWNTRIGQCDKYGTAIYTPVRVRDIRHPSLVVLLSPSTMAQVTSASKIYGAKDTEESFSRTAVRFHQQNAREILFANGAAGNLMLFRNPWALLFTFAGGLLFLPTYRRTGSMLLANAEHALYGDFLFTVGWGRFFYEGTQAMAAAVAG